MIRNGLMFRNVFKRINLKNSEGFTLAEVLITLVIIGVIGAMTIPTLMNNTNKQEYVSKLKKAYSTLSQATNKIIAEQGPPALWITTLDDFYEIYRKHLVNAKECGAGSGCWSQSKNGGLKKLNGANDDDWDGSKYRNLIIADGVQVMFTPTWFTPGCTDRCALIHIDVNGERKPNQQGRDVFTFVLYSDGLRPFDCTNDSQCDVNGRGLGCACKVLREGAMNY